MCTCGRKACGLADCTLVMAVITLIIFITSVAVPGYIHAHFVRRDTNGANASDGLSFEMSQMYSALTASGASSFSAAAATYALSWSLPSSSSSAGSSASASAVSHLTTGDLEDDTSAYHVARVVLRSWDRYDCSEPNSYVFPTMDLTCPTGDGTYPWSSGECLVPSMECGHLEGLYINAFALGLVSVFLVVGAIILLGLGCTDPKTPSAPPDPVVISIPSNELLPPGSASSDASVTGPGMRTVLINSVPMVLPAATAEENELRSRLKRIGFGLGFLGLAFILVVCGSVNFGSYHASDLYDTYKFVSNNKNICLIQLHGPSPGGLTDVMQEGPCSLLMGGVTGYVKDGGNYHTVMHLFTPIALWVSVLGLITITIAFVLGLFLLRKIKQDIIAMQIAQHQQSFSVTLYPNGQQQQQQQQQQPQGMPMQQRYPAHHPGQNYQYSAAPLPPQQQWDSNPLDVQYPQAQYPPQGQYAPIYPTAPAPGAMGNQQQQQQQQQQQPMTAMSSTFDPSGDSSHPYRALE